MLLLLSYTLLGLDCGPPPLPGNGHINGACSRGNLYESVCTFSCKGGFKQPGGPGVTKIVKCGKDGKWSGVPSDCQGKVLLHLRVQS